jgi:hypothetical protein
LILRKSATAAKAATQKMGFSVSTFHLLSLPNHKKYKKIPAGTNLSLRMGLPLPTLTAISLSLSLPLSLSLSLSLYVSLSLSLSLFFRDGASL